MGFETLNKMNAIGFIALNNTCVNTIYRAIEIQTQVEETVAALAEETAHSNFIITCLVSLVIFVAFIGCGLCCMPISRIIYREKITDAQVKKATDLAEVARIRVKKFMTKNVAF